MRSDRLPLYQPLSGRIEAFLAEPTERGWADRYLERLIDNTNVLSERLRRTTALIILLLGAFVVFSGAKTTEVTVGPFKLTNVSAVLTLIPAIVSYLYFEFVITGLARAQARDITNALLAGLYPEFSWNHLVETLDTATLQVFGEESRLRAKPPNRASKVIDKLTDLHAYGLLFGALAFIAYAYVHLFNDPKAKTYVVVASLAFAAVNVARAVLRLVDQKVDLRVDKPRA